MKTRTDFVTNSSSSSFIVAKKGKLNSAQKNAIIDYVESNMLGKPVLTPSNTEDEIASYIEENWINENQAEDIKRALGQGKTIYEGWISFEETDYLYGELFHDIWDVLEQNSDGNFESIDTGLDY